MNVRVRSTNRIRGLWGSPIMLVIGLGILFLGLQWRTFTQNQIATMLTSEGRVVEVISRTKTSGGERKTYFYPVVEFRTADGESVRFESSTGSNPSSASSRDIFGCSKNRQNRIVENSTYPLDDFGFR